ncbi:MAG: family 43 glycosylhydrolase [Micromonosporaceae bacterium]
MILSLIPAALALSSDDTDAQKTAQISVETKTRSATIPPTRATNFNHADPAAIQYRGKIYSYATDGAKSVPKIPVIVADSATGPYQRLGRSLERIPWANNDVGVMGPHVVHRGGTTFHMYFTARPAGGADEQRCIGAAVSTRGPAGPFVPRPHPLVCDRAHRGAIAPSYFKDPRTGRQYLLYKTNGPNAIRRVYLQGLGPAGLGTVGERTLLGKRSWNYENPQLMYSAGKYFLFASVDLYRTTTYRTTVNWSRKLRGPYPASRARALLTRNNTRIAGPGSAELVKLANGQTVAFFHGWRNDGGGCTSPRFLYVATIRWGANRDNPRLASPRRGGAHC